MELSPILMNSSVHGIFVYGNPGTGKSAVITSLMQELEQEAEKQSIELRSIYVNCAENRTETVILVELLSQLNPDKDYPRMGWTRAKALSEFKKTLNTLGKTNILVVLDEVDYVLRESGDDILYRLSRINGKVKPGVSTIIISNDIKVYDYIKPRTQSAFGRVKVVFSPYNEDELHDILQDRVKYAFKQGVVSGPVIRKIAEIEGSRSGDARRALELVDSCAKLAIAKKRDKITLDLVSSADKELESDNVLNTIASLTQHQKILFLAILKLRQKDLVGSRVFKKYKEICNSYNVKPLSDRRVRSFVVNLGELGLIKSEVKWLKTMKKKSRKITVDIDKGVKKKAKKMLRDSI